MMRRGRIRGSLLMAWLAAVAAAVSCYAPGDPLIEGSGGVEGTGTGGGGGGGTPLLTYWISETTNFSQSASAGCTNASLNNVGSLLQAHLDVDGWTGTYHVDGQTNRLEFIDQSLLAGGIDHLAADTVALAVYAGHGNVDLLQWGNQDGKAHCSSRRRRARASTRAGSSTTR